MSAMNEAALDAVALVREFDGASLEDKLRGIGVDPGPAIQLAADYYVEATTEMSVEDFADAFVGGLVVGAVLARR